MNIEDVKVGMKVRILPTATQEKYQDVEYCKGYLGWDDEFEDLIGTTVKIQETPSHHLQRGWVRANYYTFLAEDLEPVVETQLESVYPNPPHKHKDLIIAWANGADIEFRVSPKHQWVLTHDATFSKEYEYRIKPTQPVKPPKPEWIKVDGVRPEGIPDGTKVEWVTKDGRSSMCLINRLGFQKGSVNEVIFIKIID